MRVLAGYISVTNAPDCALICCCAASNAARCTLAAQEESEQSMLTANASRITIEGGRLLYANDALRDPREDGAGEVAVPLKQYYKRDREERAKMLREVLSIYYQIFPSVFQQRQTEDREAFEAEERREAA